MTTKNQSAQSAARTSARTGTAAKKTTTKKASATKPAAKASQPKSATSTHTRAPSPPARQVGDLVAGATDYAIGGIGTARRVLDSRGGLPAYVGTGALAVAGVLEWPVAVGVGAGYAALRRWGGRLPEPLRSLTGSNRAE